MNAKRMIELLTGVAGAALLITLVGCSSPQSEDAPIGADVIAPITMGVNDLQGTNVDLLVGQSLNIDTESLAVDSYTGQISDPDIAEFVQGRIEDSAQFNPGVNAVGPGTADVLMVNDQGGIQPLEFTITVRERE